MHEQSINHCCPQQRWIRQLLCGSTLLSRPSTMKLVSLPLVSGASLCLAFYAQPPPPLYKFTHYTGYFSPNIRPRQLHWGDWAIGIATQAYAHCTLLSGVQGNFLISILYLCYHTLPENHSHSDLSTVQRVSTYFIGLDKGKQNYWSQSSTITVLDESSQSS